MDSVEEFVKKYNLVIDKSKSSKKLFYIRSSIRNEEESLLFVKTLSQKTCTTWKELYGKYNTKRFVFHKAWVCQRSIFSNDSMNERNCGTKMEILVKNISRCTKRTDAFLLKKPPLACIICLYLRRHHKSGEDLKHLVSDYEKELFFRYFDDGCDVAEARRLYHESIQDKERCLKLHQFVPTKRQMYYLHEAWCQQRSLLESTSKNDVCNGSLILFDLHRLINAIPQEDPPAIMRKKLDCDVSPGIDPENRHHLSNNENSELIANVPVTNTDVLQENNHVNNRLSSNNSILSPVYFLTNPLQMQHIEVNTSNHLNGSILTVADSNSVSSLKPISNNQISSVATSPLSSAAMNVENDESECAINFSFNLEKNLSDLSTGLHLQDCGTSSKHKSGYKVSSEQPVYSSETSVSNPLCQSKLIVSQSNELASNLYSYGNEKPKLYCKPNIPNSFSSYEINKESVLLVADKQSVTNQIFQPVLLDTNSSQSSNQNCIIDLTNVMLPEKSKMSNKKISSQELLNRPEIFTNSVQVPLMNTLIPTNNEFSKLVPSSRTEIHITNTAFQSGGQVSMKPVCQPSQNRIVDTIYFPEPQTTQPHLDEPVKSKEEPPDLSETNDLMESKDSDFLPIIISVSSVNGVKNEENKEAVPLLNIKVEKDDNEDNLTVLSNSISVTSHDIQEDEDHQFVLSILPQLKQLPDDLKKKLKTDVQNLVSSTVTFSNKRKRKADELG